MTAPCSARFFALAVALAASAGIASAQLREDTALPQDVRAAFAWFTTLGFPDVTKAQWAEVFTGSGTQSGRPVRGFILSEKDDCFTVLTAGLEQHTFVKKATEAAHKRVSWRPLSLEEDARDLLRLLQENAATPHVQAIERRLYDWPGPNKLALRAKVFVAAQACHQRGLTALAAELCAAAKGLEWWRERDMKTKPDFRTTLEWDIGEAIMWSAVEAMGGIPEIYGGEGETKRMPSRKELLARFRIVADRCPHSEHGPRAREITATLERMVAEDDAHAAISDAELARLPVEAQVRELIFRLRDQNGRQISQPGSCDVFANFGTAQGDSPAYRLAKIGLPAVPQLIEALDDARLSRSVGFHRDFHFSHFVLTVGDCAEAVLSRIAGRYFWRPRTSSSAMTKDGETAATRALVEAWWKSVQTKGEKQTMIDMLSAGDGNIWSMVQKVRDRWPESLPGTLLAGAERASRPETREEYVWQLGDVKDAHVTAFLLTELHHGKSFALRSAAAYSLTKQKHPEALTAMLGEWSKLATSRGDGSNLDFQRVIGFLASNPSVQAMEGLAAKWEACPTQDRVQIVRDLMGASWLSASRSRTAEPADPAAIRAGEALLVRALGDSGILPGGHWGAEHCRDPRVRDFALYALHLNFPERYVFSPKALYRQRERECLAAANQWRRTQGQPELPRPHPALRPLPPEQARRVVEICFAPGLTVPEEVRRNLEKLKDTDLVEGHLVDLAIRFANAPWPGVQGLSIAAYRDGDLTGVTLEIAEVTAPGYGGHWGTTSGFVAGTTNVGFGHGNTFTKELQSGDYWKDFRSQFSAALAKIAPSDPIEASLTLRTPR